eukprot:PhF_6_TR16994/c0_g1_i1/m.25712
MYSLRPVFVILLWGLCSSVCSTAPSSCYSSSKPFFRRQCYLTPIQATSLFYSTENGRAHYQQTIQSPPASPTSGISISSDDDDDDGVTQVSVAALVAGTNKAGSSSGSSNVLLRHTLYGNQSSHHFTNHPFAIFTNSTHTFVIVYSSISQIPPTGLLRYLAFLFPFVRFIALEDSGYEFSHALPINRFFVNGTSWGPRLADVVPVNGRQHPISMIDAYVTFLQTRTGMSAVDHDIEFLYLTVDNTHLYSYYTRLLGRICTLQGLRDSKLYGAVVGLIMLWHFRRTFYER